MNITDFIPERNYQIIVLPNGKTCKVDTEDFHRVAARKWYDGNGYACSGHGGYRMHHLVLGEIDLETQEVHHKDTDKLNNCKSNLQLIGFSDHQVTKSKQSNNQSGYKGVCWKKPQGNRKGQWVAQVSKNKKKIHIGYYSTPLEAAKAYDIMAYTLFGDVALLNFPR